MNKLKTKQQLTKILAALRRQGKRIVFTNGCFDIIHFGHVKYLSGAKKLGDILVIGLNGDSSVKRLKGPKRPVNNQRDRAGVLAALSCVDYITIFSETTPAGLIKSLKPDFLVKGGDWKVEDIVGSGFVRSYGGTVESMPFVKGYSTSGIIKRVKS